MASNQIQQTGSFYLTGSFTASLGFDGTASFAKRADAVDSTLSNGAGIETFTFNGSSPNDVQLDTSSAHFNTPINNATGSLVNSGSISGNTLTLHLGDGSTLANIIASASYAVTASHALNSAGGTTDIYDNIVVTVLNYGGQDKYTINGLEAPTLTLSRAGTYRFDQSDSSNTGHPFAFREIDDTSYTTGVTQVGTPGTAGAYTEIVVGFDTPVNLRYYCTVHGNIMGNLLNVTDMFDLSATGSLQGTATNANTASLATRNVITASATLNTITFTKGDGSTFNVSIAQSGSVATASFAETADFNGLINKPTLVSGSSQISYTGITDIPYLVSESAQITLEDTTFTDGDAFSVLRTDGAGTIAFDFADRAYIRVRSQELIAKGDPLYVSGYSITQDRVLVSRADANDPAQMPVIGLATSALGVNANGTAVVVGVLDTVDTSTFTAGDELFVANGGGLTATAPTGNDEVQTVGIVIRSDATNGRIAVAARMSSDAAASATVDTGSLLVTSSITNLTQSFTKGDGTTYTNLIDLSGSTITDVTFRDAVVTGSFSGSFTGEVSGSLTNAVTASRAEGLFNSLDSGKGIESFTYDATVSGVTVDLDTGSAHFTDAINTITSSLSASLTTTDQTISASVATLSGSASDSRNAIVANISGAFSIPDGTVSSSAQTIANLPAGTVSGSAQVTGSTLITGSVNGNTLTFTKGDGSTFDLLVITSSGGSSDTGSLLTTASVSETTMSFTKGDASTFDVFITASVSASYAETASLLLGSVESASFASTASFVTASHVHGPHGTSSVATASRAITASKVDPITALSNLENFADDTAATIGGIPLGGLYRNGNFVLIRVTTPFVDTHYLTGWSDSNYVDFGATLTNFLSQNQNWSFGFRLGGTIPTNGAEITMMSTDNGAVAIELDSASSWYSYMYSSGSQGNLDSMISEPTQTDPSYWLFTYNGSTMTIYYNGSQIDTSTNDAALPATSVGNLAFGKSIIASREPWNSTVGVSAIYASNEVLASSINSTAQANNGDITSDSEYSKVDAFINVTSTGLVDLKQAFSPSVAGSLTFTAK